MKRIFALLLALLLLCTMVACSGDDDNMNEPTDLTVITDHQSITIGTYKDCFEYEIINGDEVAIVGFTSVYNLHEIAIPDKIEDCPVVKIADGAFYQCSQLTAVTVPATVTEIGSMAFAGCVQLKKITFANSSLVKLTSIGDYAFAKCVALGAVELPQTLTALGAGAFYQCTSLELAVLPQGITEIKQMTFMGCEKLVTAASSNAAAIGDYAFCGCAALESLNVPAGVLQSIGKYAFSGCKKLPVITDPDILIGENAFS